MTAGKNFTLWPFQVNRPARKSDHTRKRSLKLEALEERQMLAVTPWEYASHMQDAYEYEDVSSYGPLDDMEDHWTEEDEAAAEAERLQLTAAALRERLRGYGVSSMVSKQVYGPETLEQYRAVTFGLGVRNAGLDNPSLLNNGEFDNAYEVDTLWDVIDPNDGYTSLREAIISANTFAGYDLITFASGLTGTIYLSGTALPTITEGLNIQGPGDDVLTIDAGDLSRIFVIVGTDPNDPTPDVPTGLSGASSATGDSVTLSWTASADANMYAVYRRPSGGYWSYLDETTETSYTDDTVNPETTYEYYLIAANDTTGQMSSPSTTVTVTTLQGIWIDLDIDSFNMSRFAMPDRVPFEDDIEDDPNKFGKLIYPNFGDRDNDGTLDCWDGFAFTGYYTQANPNSSEQFVPIVLQIATNNLIDYANTTITFEYMMAEMVVLPDKTTAPSYSDGEIRIWTRDGHQVRMLWNLNENGHLVESGVAFTLQELGFVDEYGNVITDTITLYVECVSNSSQLAECINVRADYVLTSGVESEAYDTVRYTVKKNDAFGLSIDSDNSGVINRSQKEDQIEENSPVTVMISSTAAPLEYFVPMIFEWNENVTITSQATVEFYFPNNYVLFAESLAGPQIVSGQTYNLYQDLWPWTDGIMILYVGATSNDSFGNTQNFIEVLFDPDGDGPRGYQSDIVAVTAFPSIFGVQYPSVGVIGDIHAVEGTNDTISFNIMRKGDISQELKVRFSINWAASNTAGLTINDFKDSANPIRLEKLLVPGTTNTYEITIPAGQILSETIYLKAYEDDSQVVGENFVEIATLTILPGTGYSIVSMNGEKIDKKDYTTMRPSTNLIVFEEVTLFGDQNATLVLADPTGNSGIDMNDIRQGSLGDCYFMAALLALVDNHPAWVLSQITGTPFSDYYTIKMYNQDGTRYQDILFDRNSNLLSNGQDMAKFSNDYIEWIENGNTLRAIEVWPQLYEKAWAYMNGGAYSRINLGGSCSAVWTALTGRNATQTNCLGKTHNEILQIIDDAKAEGKIVCIWTKPQSDAMSSTGLLAGMATGDHAYYLTGTSINDYTLVNPWNDAIDYDQNPPTTQSRDVILSDLINRFSGHTDLSQYVTAIYILDPLY